MKKAGQHPKAPQGLNAVKHARSHPFDDLNTIAWRDFLLWAWNEPEMRAQFTAKTGVEIQSITITSPINVAIDAATGARESEATQFIEWATREHWGIEHAPTAYQKALKKAARAS